MPSPPHINDRRPSGQLIQEVLVHHASGGRSKGQEAYDNIQLGEKLAEALCACVDGDAIYLNKGVGRGGIIKKRRSSSYGI